MTKFADHLKAVKAWRGEPGSEEAEYGFLIPDMKPKEVHGTVTVESDGAGGYVVREQGAEPFGLDMGTLPSLTSEQFLMYFYHLRLLDKRYCWIGTLPDGRIALVTWDKERHEPMHVFRYSKGTP